jgi:hypothetical protein
MAVASYSLLANLQTQPTQSAARKTSSARRYGVMSYGASASWSHELLDGTFNASFNLTDNTPAAGRPDTNGENALGFSTMENYSSQILGWHVTGSFGYAQNVQTLLVTYMNSFYNYSGNARRRWGKFNVSGGGGGSRTALTEQPGTANSSESYNASWYGAVDHRDRQLLQSQRPGLATGAGLVPVPVPSPILSSSLSASSAERAIPSASPVRPSRGSSSLLPTQSRTATRPAMHPEAIPSLRPTRTTSSTRLCNISSAS